MSVVQAIGCLHIYTYLASSSYTCGPQSKGSVCTCVAIYFLSFIVQILGGVFLHDPLLYFMRLFVLILFPSTLSYSRCDILNININKASIQHFGVDYMDLFLPLRSVKGSA